MEALCDAQNAERSNLCRRVEDGERLMYLA